MSNKLRLGIIFFYIAVSHIFLPYIIKKNDYFIFYKWNLFNDVVVGEVYEISWNNSTGKTYLFRDYKSRDKKISMLKRDIFKSITSDNIGDIQKKYLDKLKELCVCDQVSVEILSGSLADHMINKIELKPIKVFEL